jgi:ribonuclease HI
MATKQKFYVVWKGRKTGIFKTWDECKNQVFGFDDASYKSFPSYAQAEYAFNNSAPTFSRKISVEKTTRTSNQKFIEDSLVVDAACSGNPGDMEYQGIYLKTREKLFAMGPYKDGTNNIGEFLAIVHALAFCKKNNLSLPIYSDSKTAIAWVRNKKAKTNLERTSRNTILFELRERAETWLKTNPYPNKIQKWETEIWGENPADFGRK